MFRVFLFLLTITTISCSSSEKRISSFENYLDSFVGKKVRDVLNAFGKPTTYYNTIDLPGQTSGTYIIYDYTKKNKDCIIKIRYQTSNLKVTEWDYEGRGCSRYIIYY